QVGQSLALAVDHVQPISLDRIVLGSPERVDVSLDHGQRRAQLVRDLADEAGPGMTLSGQPGGHGVDARGQRVDLSRTTGGHARTVLTGADLFGERADLVDE